VSLALSRSRARSADEAPRVVVALLPIMVVVLSGFLVTGLAMPVLPLHVHQRLGLGEFVVGLVAGAQFAAALITRFWAGTFADRRGAKYAVVIGLALAAASGLLYLLSLHFVASPVTSIAILIAGRGVLGAAESAMITGALSWGLAIGGAQNAGKVMAWVGTAMYAAFAAGAPAGSALYARFGFSAIAIATTILPLLTLLVIMPLPAIPAKGESRASFRYVLRAVMKPGIGLAFSSFGFGAITTFVALLFAAERWGNAWVAFTALSVTFILARMFLGHLPDRLGGARVALLSVIVEAAGQVLIWLGPSPEWAFAGAALTGLGYSLVYPAFGVEALRDVPPQSHGLAMGAYTAFLDLALGIANPLLGAIANAVTIRSTFVASALVILMAAIVAMSLMRNSERRTADA
jgi:MFS family permease